MARTNTAPPAAPTLDTHNMEGTRVRNLTPYLELRRTVLSCLLWEDSFYESGETIAARIQRLCSEVTPEQLANLAIQARSEMKLRHVPLLLAVQLAAQDKGRALVARVLQEVIQRPDELTEFLSLYWGGQGDRRKLGNRGTLGKQVQKGLARAFQKFSAYSLAKYNRENAIRLRDVLFLVHAKPKDTEQERVWRQLVEGTLPTPDTWEVELSAGKDKLAAWIRLLAEEKLGALALLRNLRNMREAGVSDTVLSNALRQMKTERVLPFRFIAAARYAPTLEPALEDAMFRCLAGIKKLAGRTALVIDTSPSMWQDTVSAKSELTRFDAAAALAILARELCQDGVVYAFNERAYEVPARRGFALRDSLAGTKGSASCGGLAVEMANRAGYDRIIVVTDGQWHYSNLQTMKPAGTFGQSYFGQPYGITGEGDAVSVAPAPLTDRAYMINVATQRRGVGYGKWTSIDGWSEAVLDYISQSELAPGEQIP